MRCRELDTYQASKPSAVLVSRVDMRPQTLLSSWSGLSKASCRIWASACPDSVTAASLCVSAARSKR